MSETISELAFLSIFHVIGGAALGLTLRSLVREPSLKGLFGRVFFLIWGGMFGCMPLAFSLQDGGLNYTTLAFQLGILGTAMAVPFFLYDYLREYARDKNMVRMGIGAALFLFSAALSGAIIGSAGLDLPSLLIFTIFGGGGGYLVVTGFRRVMIGREGEEEGESE